MNEGNSNVNESTHPCPSQAWEGMNEGHSNANESTHPYPSQTWEGMKQEVSGAPLPLRDLGDKQGP